MDVAPAPWMMPIDYDILDFFDAHPIRISPSNIAANIDYSRQYVAKRCRALKHAGLLFHDEGRLYTLTPFGETYLAGNRDPDTIKEGPPNHYTGVRQGSQCTVIADTVELADRINFRHETIDEYTWGYVGGGSRKLAKALLGDYFDGQIAVEHCNDFMNSVVVTFDEHWELSAAELQAFLDEIETD